MSYKPLGKKRHRCKNCELNFVGKYCPRCGQEADSGGKSEWKNLKEGILEPFDIEKRSLPRTLWQLLWRPGYLIDDYLSGKRQRYSAPINTLILVGVVFMMIQNLIGSEAVTQAELYVPGEGRLFIDDYMAWSAKNKGWSYMVACLYVMLTTWVFFDHSPRHNRHTLVQGLYIQVFLFTEMLMIGIFFDFIELFVEVNDAIVLLWAFFYLFALGPLFGYGIWGTLWRSVLCILLAAKLQIISLFMVDIVMGHQFSSMFLLSQGIGGAILIMIMLIGFLIGRYTEKKRARSI